MEIILGEARALRDAGVREMILLAQDTTDYGHDLGMKDGLVSLLQGLVAAAPEMDWIRILYTFPGAISDALIETMAIHPQILPYLDIPLQHAHPDTLRRMGRPANVDLIHHSLEKMRLAMPDLSLRTTFIVGFPGETDEEFNTLLEFVREIRIDKMGAFQYSCESGTPAEPLGDPVPAEVKQARWEQLMILQQGISLEKNQALVGRSLQVLVEGRGQVEVGSGLVRSDLETRPYSLSDGEKEQAILVGRSYRDAPEIDGLVLVEGLAPDETVPDMVQVHITGAMAYDLVGQLILNK
jgi:ribosomal protein S12 methylthiotransferase